ncbi:MAG: pitrilysin family protein, partial [Gemmatimonadota bacterium]
MTPVDRERPPAPGPVRPFAFPHVHRGALANGLAVLAARAGDLPLVTAQVVLDAGAVREDAGRAGLAQLTACLLDAGAGGRDGDALAWELERLGVALEATAGWDALVVGLTVHADRLEPALALLADIVRRPDFPEDEVGRLRDEQLAGLVQRRADPRLLAGDMATRFLYAADAPYARPLPGTDETVAELTPADVSEFHGRWFVAPDSALVLVGALDPESAPELAERFFGDWDGAAPGPVAASSAPRAVEPVVHLVDRPGAVQTELRMGHVGVARGHPDHFPLQVMNSLLGGAFTSRLNMNLREKHGFTYGVRSGFTMRRLPGPFLIQTAVATAVTARAVEEVLKEVARLREEGAPEGEVAANRDYLAGVQPLQLQTTEQVAGHLTDLVVYGLPDDWYDTYAARIQAVTPEEVHRVAREYVRPERMATVVVGAADALAEALAGLGAGPVERHALSGHGGGEATD